MHWVNLNSTQMWALNCFHANKASFHIYGKHHDFPLVLHTTFKNPTDQRLLDENSQRRKFPKRKIPLLTTYVTADVPISFTV